MSKVRRRPRWALFAVFGVLLLIGWFNVRQSQSTVHWGRQLFLHDGRVQIIAVEDAVTLVVEALDDPARQFNGTFRVRLMGIEPPRPDHPHGLQIATDALTRTEAFVRRCPQGVATLIYDRQRFDESETPLAYVFCGDDCLNAELLESGLVRLKQPAGLPSKWMRDLIKISRDPELGGRSTASADSH